MKIVKDFLWKHNTSVKDFLSEIGSIGFQSVELKNASDLIVKMKGSGAKIYLTFTSNMVTSGLRGFFAQLINLKMADIIVTTAGAIEEDFMKATGANFTIKNFNTDDYALHEKGENRVGNLIIRNEDYTKFEDKMLSILNELYEKKKVWTPCELISELGKIIDDENSILHQAERNNVPVFCPGITDGAIGFHLFMFKEKHPDFVIDVAGDFKNIVFASNHDEKKAIISLGGGISKHHAILSGLLNGGFDYALYMTTANASSGSMSGATTQEAKSWGKIKDDSDAVTVIGDVTVNFPLAMCRSLDLLKKGGII